MDDVVKSVNKSGQLLQLWNDESVFTEQLLKFIIEKSPGAILITDTSGRIVFANSAIGEVLNHQLAVGNNISRIDKLPLYHPKDTPIEARDLTLSQAILEGKSITNIEMIFFLPDDQRRNLMVNTKPVLGNDEQVLGVVVIFQDVTESKQSQRDHHQSVDQIEKDEKKLKEDFLSSEEKFSVIFENSIFGIAFLDENGMIISSNLKLQNMLDFQEEELTGFSFINLFPSKERKGLEAIFQLMTAGKKNLHQVEIFFHRQHGEVHRFEITFSKASNASETDLDDGDPRFVLAVVKEVTEIFALQENLRRADRVDIIDRLGITLAHEINNPLQSAIGCLGIAEEILEGGNEAHRFLQIAIEELDRVVKLVKQLQDLGYKPDLQKTEFVNLNTLLKKTTTLIRKKAQTSRVKVEWEPADNLPLVPEIPGFLIQVFTNLALNAIEAMPNGGRLQICTNPTNNPNGVIISFSDNGVGIEPESLSRIFEPFHSTHNIGFGLGLYICQKNVEEHGGKIEVESQVGVGTTFTIWLPGKQTSPVQRSRNG